MSITEEKIKLFEKKYQSFELGEPINIEQFNKLKAFLESTLEQVVKETEEDMIKKVEKEAIWEEYGKGFIIPEDRWEKLKKAS